MTIATATTVEPQKQDEESAAGVDSIEYLKKTYLARLKVADLPTSLKGRVTPGRKKKMCELGMEICLSYAMGLQWAKDNAMVPHEYLEKMKAEIGRATFHAYLFALGRNPLLGE